MLREALEILDRHGLPGSYKFLKVLASKVNENKSAHIEIARMMQTVYENRMLDSQLKDSAEIDNANAQLMTVYELPSAQTSRETYNRCKAYLNSVNKEIEFLIRKTWPSHHEALRKEGIL
jgi:chromosome partitioning protein